MNVINYDIPNKIKTYLIEQELINKHYKEVEEELALEEATWQQHLNDINATD